MDNIIKNLIDIDSKAHSMVLKNDKAIKELEEKSKLELSEYKKNTEKYYGDKVERITISTKDEIKKELKKIKDSMEAECKRLDIEYENKKKFLPDMIFKNILKEELK